MLCFHRYFGRLNKILPELNLYQRKQYKLCFSTKTMHYQKNGPLAVSSAEVLPVRKGKPKMDKSLSVAAEMFLDEVKTSEVFPESEELKMLSQKLENLDSLLNKKLALDNPGMGVVFEENISEEELDKYIIANKRESSYGATDDYVEHVMGTDSTENLTKGYSYHETDRGIDSIYLYGSPDVTIPMSDTPCGGCGAKLHCQEPAIPGYIPSQKFISIPHKELRNTICQRCHILNKYKIALNVAMTPEDYLQIVGQIKAIQALVVLVVDVTDFPNSMFKGFSQLVGKGRPVYVIGNKVDLLPSDSQGYLGKTKDMIMHYMREYDISTTNYIKHVQLVSAKTGYGIEELVTKLMTEWHRKGDVYVVGCTNVGKSTLYNAFLSSDYCKDNARDYIHRATISNWPGTTLNTLKFPIINPAKWRLKMRADRLLKSRSDYVEEARLRKSKYKDTGGLENITLMGHIGQTFVGKEEKTLSELEYQGYSKAMFTADEQDGEIVELPAGELEYEKGKIKHKLNNYDESVYANSWWCYDTPGVINPEQIINLLGQEELTHMLTKRLIQPRTFVLKPDDTIFVSGLSRIDYVQGNTAIYFTVFCSMNLPVHVTRTADADQFYDNYVGTDKLKVPVGDVERLIRLPSLIGKQINITGIGWMQSAADILLSSVGWVSVTAGRAMDVNVRAYTPGGYGCKLRQPALLSNAVNQRGKRKKGTKEYQLRNQRKKKT